MRLALYALSLATLVTVQALPAKRSTSPNTMCAFYPLIGCVCANTAAGVTYGNLGSFTNPTVAVVVSMVPFAYRSVT